jgi:hypothetical protein
MRFVSTLPKLQVQLQAAKQGFDPNTGRSTDPIPSVMARFNFGIYETTDKRVIEMMLVRMIKITRAGMQLTYGVHPSDLAEIADIKNELEKKEDLTMPEYSMSSPAQRINEKAALEDAMQAKDREIEILKKQLEQKQEVQTNSSKPEASKK